jgi:hypothetical protein
VDEEAIAPRWAAVPEKIIIIIIIIIYGYFYSSEVLYLMWAVFPSNNELLMRKNFKKILEMC